jgi:hypothetical protein
MNTSKEEWLLKETKKWCVLDQGRKVAPLKLEKKQKFKKNIHILRAGKEVHYYNAIVKMEVQL